MGNAEWARSGLQQAPPLSTPIPVAAASMTSDTPTAVTAGSSVVAAALAFGGRLVSFPLSGGVLGLGANLPPHGCVEEEHIVLVKIARRGSSTKRGAVSPAWEFSARSAEQRLAEALLAAIVSQLKYLPTKD